MPIFAFEKVSIPEEMASHAWLIALIAVMTLITLIYWPLASRLRNHYQPHLQARSVLPIQSKAAAWINYFLLMAFFLGLAISLSDPISIVYSVPSSLKVTLILPLVVIATTLLMLLMLLRIITNQRYRVWSRIYYLLACVTSLLAIWQLYYWNLIGFNY